MANWVGFSYELFVSEAVLNEVAVGDPIFATKRIAMLDDLPRLPFSIEGKELAARLLATGIIPAKATADAFHLAIAATNGVDFLLTWNCKHIHNIMIERRVRSVCMTFGVECPIICTPAELMGN